jgi:nucleoside-specific outer membrane channel protein Tsx
MRSRSPRLALALVACALAAAAPAARAEGFSTTNLQLLQGYAFDDNKYGYQTKSGLMTTLTLNHFSTWELGDNFAFFDLYAGNFVDGNPPNGVPPGAKLYAEWHPRLFLNKVFGTKGDLLGFIRNWGVAGEVNWGPGFYAYLIGVGFDFAFPPPYSVGLNVYYRYDRFDYHEWQVSPFWNVPFSIGPVPFLFTGFVDISGTKNATGGQGVDVVAQPELLVDVLAPFGGKANRIYVGTEWYLHAFPDGVYGAGRVVSAPQVMVQWTVY